VIALLAQRVVQMGGGAALLLALAAGCPGNSSLPAEGPEQPIRFSHAQHSGELRIDCRHCHTLVSRTAVAGLPTVAKCEGCHAGVKKDRTTAEMAKITKRWEERRPILWTKVNDLPDHVRFDHGAHVRSQVSCGACHGEVNKMTRVRQVESFNMSFCVDCHRAEGARLDCTACHK
jgi:hypothetical protein